MTLCLRNISTKLPPFSSSRNQLGQSFDRYSVTPKDIKSSSFLDEFFGTCIWSNNLRQTALQSSLQYLYLNDRQRIYAKDTMRVQRLLPHFTRASALESRDVYLTTPMATMGMAWRKAYAKQPIPQSYSIRRITATSDSLLLSTNLLENEQAQQNTDNKNQPKDELEKVFQTLGKDLPKLFTTTMNYRIYDPDIEFVNNFRGMTSRGIAAYVRQVALMKTIGHFKFAYVKFNVLKITMHPQDNTVRVRWRITGITGMKALLMFWKFKPWNIRESLKEQETWIDGFSTFYVNAEGRVYRHIADKMMPDQDMEETKEKQGIPAKLATPLFAGLAANTNWISAANFFDTSSTIELESRRL